MNNGLEELGGHNVFRIVPRFQYLLPDPARSFDEVRKEIEMDKHVKEVQTKVELPPYGQAKFSVPHFRFEDVSLNPTPLKGVAPSVWEYDHVFRNVVAARDGWYKEAGGGFILVNPYPYLQRLLDLERDGFIKIEGTDLGNLMDKYL
ncbi:hypothetical protein K8I28_00765 [bacterium]|nr:hypothetical protein [bacterium]